MEGQNTSSHTVLPAGFVSCSFPSTFSGIGSQSRNVSNPLLMSTLHHLQGFTASGGATLLPNSSSLTINGHFANEFGAIANMGWSSQNPSSVWLEQAKVAAMLPVYGVLSTSTMKASDGEDLNVASPTKEMDSSVPNPAVSTPSFTITPSSGIFPLNPGGLTGVSEDAKPQQPSPLNFCQEVQPKDTSPPESAPSSIQSHCTGDIRPCSSSALSSQGPGSVSVCSNSGSVEPVVLHGDLASNTPNYVQTDVVSIKSDSNVDASYGIPVLSSVPFSTVNEPCTSGIDTSAPMESTQPYVFSVEEEVVRNELLQRQPEEETPAVSNGDAQDFQFAGLEQTPGSSHDNGLDPANLDDLPWSSIDLGDIDLFNGASAADKDVMDSVLDMDPSAMQPIFSGEPSTSDVVLDSAKDLVSPSTTNFSSSQFNMPKFREKIKMRREKELADADKEFDRLLSLVAKKDAKPEPVSRLPPSLSALDCVLFAKAGSSAEKISLSPVEFTPPDSPTPLGSSSVASDSIKTFFFPTSLKPSTSSVTNTNPTTTPKPNSIAPLVFMPTIEKKSKINKVPVYRQNVNILNCPEVKPEDNLKNDDAYSFTDDELDDKPLPSSATLTESQLKEQRLEAEVAQKLAKINCAHPKKSGSLDQQHQQDLWKHVVPKKRHSISVSERSSASSSSLLPPPSTSDTNNKEIQPATSSSEVTLLSQILRRRMQHRTSSGFLSAKFLDDRDMADEGLESNPEIPERKPHLRTDMQNVQRTTNQCPPLPRLLLRIPRRSIESLSSASEKGKKEKKKKKKKKKKDRDRDWEGCEKKKRKKKHKHKQQKRDHQIYEVVTVDSDQWCQTDSARRPAETAVYSKKQRLMQWTETENDLGGGNEDVSFYKKRSYVNYETQDSSFDTEWNAPAGFSQTEGSIAKGTFVVSKADVLKENCPLWRVDSQSLLQKYVPIKCDQRLFYKSISTYSGWCDQISDGYLIVKVQYIKHSRAETIVEPEVPLADMFPAVSVEISASKAGTEQLEHGDGKNNLRSLDSFELDFNMKKPLRDHLLTYVKALLNHAVDLSFLQSVKLKNDWDYLRALNEVEKLNEEKKEKVMSHVKWTDKYVELLHFYSSCALCDSDGSGLKCQACGANPVEKVIQLFSSESYNHDTLESEELRCIGAGSPMPATEYLVCDRCAKSSLLYHKLHHMRYLVLKQCEDQMELISYEEPLMPTESVIERCLNNHKWLNNVLSDYVGTWRKVDLNTY